MNFESDLLKRHSDGTATLVLADGLAITGKLSVNDDNFNIDPDRGYDLQTNNDDGDGICALISRLADGETQEIPEGSPEVTLLFGERVAVRGTLAERRDGNGEDGLVLLAGNVSYRAVAPGADMPSDPDAGWTTCEAGSVCVVNAEAVTSGLPEASAEEGGEGDDDDAGEGSGGDTEGDDDKAGEGSGGDTEGDDDEAGEGEGHDADIGGPTVGGGDGDDEPRASAPTGSAVNPD